MATAGRNDRAYIFAIPPDAGLDPSRVKNSTPPSAGWRSGCRNPGSAGIERQIHCSNLLRRRPTRPDSGHRPRV